MRGAEFGDAERQRSHELLVRVDEVGRNLHIQQWSIRWDHALVLVFVAVRGDQVGAVDRAIDGDFALCAAADGADFLAFGRAKPGAFSFFADWTGHGGSARRNRIVYDTPRGGKRQMA